MAAIGAGGLGGGCSVQSDEPPRPGSCYPFSLIAVDPMPGDREVPTNVAPALTFSDLPDPDTVGLATLSLTISGFRYTGTYEVDLVDNLVTFQPSGPLQAGIGLTLVLQPRVRSLRGCQLEPPPPYPSGEPADAYYLDFHTLDPDVTPPPKDPPPPVPTFSEVQQLLAARCAGGCHLGDADPDPAPCLTAPAGGLSLCPAEAHAALVGIASRQVARLVQVVPRDSARSYLLRKLLGAPPLAGHLGPPGGPPLTREELHLIRRWIDAGAQD